MRCLPGCGTLRPPNNTNDFQPLLVNGDRAAAAGNPEKRLDRLQASLIKRQSTGGGSPNCKQGVLPIVQPSKRDAGCAQRGTQGRTMEKWPLQALPQVASILTDAGACKTGDYC
jgi:hypothetical protein